MNSLSVSDIASISRFVRTLRDSAAMHRIYEAALRDFLRIVRAHAGDGPLTTTLLRLWLKSRACQSTTKTQYVAAASEALPSLKKKKITPHTWRHTVGVHLTALGIDVVTIRDVLGHSSIETTNLYARSDVCTQRKALAQVDWLDPGNRHGSSRILGVIRFFSLGQ